MNRIAILTIIIIWLCVIQTSLRAQSVLPQKIIISKGRCNSSCGYTNGFHDLRFGQELEYNLTDSSFRYRKKLHQSFKKIDAQPTILFTSEETYIKLDSMFDNFTSFKMSPGKYTFYKIDLIYYTDKTGLPSKIKTMVFLWTYNPRRIHPAIIDQFREGYYKIIPQNFFTY